MNRRQVILVNANEMKPPVAPLALDYLGGRLQAAGFDVRLVDLSFEAHPRSAMAGVLDKTTPLFLGVSFRNTDDCFWPSCDWFVPRLRELIGDMRALTPAPIVMGGCGFSIFPAAVLEHVDADWGVIGDAEDTLLGLAEHLVAEREVRRLPGLVYRDDGGQWVVNSPSYSNGALDIPSGRALVDNARYFREGGMGNIETKRGCPMPCIYCADPAARGSVLRCRPPSQVADEIEHLAAQGVDVLHFCDGEFNIPPDHAMAVCEEIARRRLGERVRWYGYASVHPFPDELAPAMRKAGCVGINFGADSGSNRMLQILRRGYDREAIRQAVRVCKQQGLTVMLDLMLGGPGEDQTSVAETIEFVKKIDPHRCGAATGIRLYPGTPLADTIRQQGSLADNPHLHGQVEDNDSLLRPVFYIDRQLGDDAGGLVCDLIGGDQRFFPPPRLQGVDNYNYNDNTTLERAITAGHRGAFWDILRRLAEGS